MESKEYRVEEYTGEIYTEEEFIARYKNVASFGVVLEAWNELSEVPLQEPPSEELRKKMRFIYSEKRHSALWAGDIIKKDLTRKDWALVEEIVGNKILVLHYRWPGDIPTSGIWEGPFVKLVSPYGQSGLTGIVGPAAH